MNIFVQLVLFQFDLILYSGIDIKSEGEAGGSTSAEVKSFASYKKCKAKQWKARVTKSSKDENKQKKNQDVVVHVGLMAWNEKDQALKPKRGQRLPLRISPTAGYVTLRKQAEEKWKTYHSNLYDESQSYHLLLEDGRKALFLPGSNKKSFTLGRYQEEVRKDFKRITLFLCPELDYQISEGNFDENDLSDFENDGTDSPNKRRKWEIDLTCEFHSQTNSKHDCLDNDQELEQSLQVEADHPPQQDQKPGHGPSERDLERHQQLEQDKQFASDLQRIYDAEDIIVPKDDNNSMISDCSSVATFLGKQVDQSSQLFVVMRRGAPLNRVLSIWSREVKKNSASVKQTVRVHFSGEEGIDSGALAKEFTTMTLPKIGSVIFPNGQPVDSTFNVHNGNFKACGEIVAASIAQGGPAPRFLEESVYGLMANPNVPLQELDMGRHLTATDRELLNTIRDDITAHTDTIVEHSYTGSINASHIEEIISSVAISLVSKRLVYLKEFVDGFDTYGLRSIIQTHPEACEPLFVQDVSSHDQLMQITCFHHCAQNMHQKAAQEEKLKSP